MDIKIKMLALELVFSLFFVWIFCMGFSRKVVSDRFDYIEIKNLVEEEHGGVNCNFYVEGLEVEEIDGF